MKATDADNLLNHYFPDLPQKERDRILRFASTFSKEIQGELQYQKELADFNRKQFQKAINLLEEEIEILTLKLQNAENDKICSK